MFCLKRDERRALKLSNVTMNTEAISQLDTRGCFPLMPTVLQYQSSIPIIAIPSSLARELVKRRRRLDSEIGCYGCRSHLTVRCLWKLSIRTDVGRPSRAVDCHPCMRVSTSPLVTIQVWKFDYQAITNCAPSMIPFAKTGKQLFRSRYCLA